MGAWGHKALESDNGLDVIDCIKEYISSEYPNTNTIDLTLSEVVKAGCIFSLSCLQQVAAPEYPDALALLLEVGHVGVVV